MLDVANYNHFWWEDLHSVQLCILARARDKKLPRFIWCILNAAEEEQTVLTQGALMKN